MSLTNPPPAVTALRDMLLACASVAGYGIDTDTINYPESAPSPDAGTASALPLITLAEIDSDRIRYAEGAGGIPAGQLTVTIQAVDTVGNLETLARAISKELMELQVGLYLPRAPSQLAGQPSLASEAQADTDTGANISGITINVTYGLGA